MYPQSEPLTRGSAPAGGRRATAAFPRLLAHERRETLPIQPMSRFIVGRPIPGTSAGRWPCTCTFPASAAGSAFRAIIDSNLSNARLLVTQRRAMDRSGKGHPRSVLTFTHTRNSAITR